MSLEQNLNDNSLEEIEIEAMSSFDDFLKELEEAEKNLHITATDTVVEVEDSFDDSRSADYEVQAAAEEFALETFAPAEGQNVSARDKSHELHDLRMKVSTLEGERGELRQVLLRRQTDFDNFRKRTERERSETFENILSKLSSKMLPVLDNLSRALESSKKFSSSEKAPEFEQLVQGILLVNQQLTDVLFEMGVQPIASVGHPFDPHFHEAVATVETGEEPGTVVEEMLTGYKIGKQVVRPAMVKVSVAPAIAPPIPPPAIPPVIQSVEVRNDDDNDNNPHGNEKGENENDNE